MRHTNYISILTDTVYIISMNALHIKLSRIRSHDSSYSRVAVNFHVTCTCMTMLDVSVGHAAT